jgi:8-oxo-dGTP diphosphatase
MEPNKCENWEWFNWENFPSPLFVPIENLKKQDFHPYR